MGEGFTAIFIENSKGNIQLQSVSLNLSYWPFCWQYQRKRMVCVSFLTAGEDMGYRYWKLSLNTYQKGTCVSERGIYSSHDLHWWGSPGLSASSWDSCSGKLRYSRGLNSSKKAARPPPASYLPAAFLLTITLFAVICVLELPFKLSVSKMLTAGDRVTSSPHVNHLLSCYLIIL